MENKIQELTEKIFNEGVEKGKLEADRLIAEAQEKAAAILKEAQEKADNVVAEAQKKATELDVNTRSELKLYGSQAVSALKSEAANIITDTIVSSAVKEVLAGDALKNILVKIAERWSADEPLVISTSEADELKAYFAAKAKALLRENAAKLLRITYDRLLPFKKPDGSFSYCKNCSSFWSQGKPVCIENSYESDVNANSLANGSKRRTLLILDIPTPPIFDENDSKLFFELCGEAAEK
jgi:V/A-type H+-transporting ATPase subunit E